jgi:hypothetical protein
MDVVSIEFYLLNAFPFSYFYYIWSIYLTEIIFVLVNKFCNSQLVSLTSTLENSIFDYKCSTSGSLKPYSNHACYFFPVCDTGFIFPVTMPLIILVLHKYIQ